MNIVTRETEATILKDVIYKFGCIRMDQLKEFLPDTPKVRKDPNCHVAICKNLVYSQSCFLENDVMYPFIKPTYDQKTIDAIWILIKYVKETRGKYALASFFRECTKPQLPCSLFFLASEAGDAVKVLSIPAENQLMTIVQAQEQFYRNTGIAPGEEKKAHLSFIFAIRDEKLLYLIEDLKITVPHKIALIKDKASGEPEITFLEPEK